MPAYATNAEFASFVEGWVTDDAAALTRLLERASRDIDAIFGPVPVRTSGTYAGYKLDPTILSTPEKTALSRATCAQAEHRFRIGDTDLGGRQATKVTGPDFSAEYLDAAGGATGLYSPRLPLELAPLARRRRLTGRL